MNDVKRVSKSIYEALAAYGFVVSGLTVTVGHYLAYGFGNIPRIGFVMLAFGAIDAVFDIDARLQRRKS